MKRILLGVIFSIPLWAQSPIASFTLPELFGAAWPNQNIEMRYDAGYPASQTSRMIGPAGSEVPYQWISGANCWDPTATNGCILVQDSLGSYATNTYTLQSGVAPAATVTHPVTVASGTCQSGVLGWIVSNGLTGFCVPKTQSSPYNYAPIQGIKLADGSWTGAISGKANLLYTSALTGSSEKLVNLQGNGSNAISTPASIFTGETTTFLDQGPLKTSVQLSYTANRPLYYNGQGTILSSTSTTLTFSGSAGFDANTPAVVFFGSPAPPSPLTINQYYYLSNCVVATNITCNVSATPGGPIITNLGRFAAANCLPVVNPYGPGHYTINITLYANHPSFSLDWDSDIHAQWFVPFYAAVHPTVEEYRSFGSSQVACGHEPTVSVSSVTNTNPAVVTIPYGYLVTGEQVVISGVSGSTGVNGTFYVGNVNGQAFTPYLDAALTTPLNTPGVYTGGGSVELQYNNKAIGYSRDGFVDLNYNSDQFSGGQCIPGTVLAQVGTNYPPAWYDGGWYEMMYDSTAGANAPVIGLFAGRFSKLSLVSGPERGQPGWFVSNSHWLFGAGSSAGIEEVMVPNENSITAHGNFGIYVDIAGNLPNPFTQQHIGDEMNNEAGINLSSLYMYTLSYNDPAGGWQWPYMGAADFQKWTSLFQNGTAYCGSANCFYNEMYNSEPSSRLIQDMWHYNDSSHVATAYNAIASNVMTFVSGTLAHGDNHWAGETEYAQLFLNLFQPYFPQCTAILMNQNSTDVQRNGCKAVLALGGSLVWDNDWFPWDNNSGDGRGLGNQQVGFTQFRATASSQLYFHPKLMAKVATGNSYTVQAVSAMSNPFGSGAGSTHYQGVYTIPTFLTFQTAALSNQLSFTSYPWKQHSRWLLSALTPPEPRFGTARKCISDGDGNTEAGCAALNGLIAEGFFSTDPTTAGNAQWGWAQTNTSSTYTVDQNTIWSINPLVQQITPPLNSSNFPGYWSVARYGFGGGHETSVHFINGDFYSAQGHRHADSGQVTIYAHNAPLAIDWNANLYSPETPARFCHNSIVLDSELAPNLSSWSADQPNCLTVATGTPASNNTNFSAFTNSTQSIGTFTFVDGTVWTRVVRMIAADLAYPLIYVKDTFSGPSATTPKTLTWQLMATGSVLTPVGVISPIMRYSGPPNAPTGCNSVPAQYPSNGAVYSLANGLQQFTFTGASWPAHATGGINWDLWQIPASGAAQFFIGNWGHGCNTTRETGEFQATNGIPFNERQHILRVHDTGTFQTLIAPYRNGETPSRTISMQACGAQIIQGTETTCFNDSALTYSNGTETVLTTYDSSSQSAYGFTASGGAQELVRNGFGTITWTIDDITPGTRNVKLPPGTWFPSIPVQYSAGTYSYYQGGGPQPNPVIITFTQNLAVLRTVNLNYRSPTGATQVRVKFGSSDNYAAITACSPVCSVTLQAPVGTWPEQHDFLDGNGAVIASSTTQNMVIQ